MIPGSATGRPFGPVSMGRDARTARSMNLVSLKVAFGAEYVAIGRAKTHYAVDARLD
jgi:hypothetical protein